MKRSFSSSFVTGVRRFKIADGVVRVTIFLNRLESLDSPSCPILITKDSDPPSFIFIGVAGMFSESITFLP